MKFVTALLRLVVGFLVYSITGKTPEKAYLAMRYLHSRTDGRLNDLFLGCMRLIRPAKASGGQSRLCVWTPEDVELVSNNLKAEGLAILPWRVPESACERLEAFARKTPALPLGKAQRELYDPETANALRYDFAADDILRDPVASDLTFDPLFASISAAYFGCRPDFDFVTMWWTTAKGLRDLSGAAQQFHYDMDRFCFLKFFVYLTDVDERNGPHIFVRRSHRRKPKALRRDGRFEDAEVVQHYPESEIMRITGSRGMMFAADTRGLHKGQPVLQGDRLVLQLEFCVSRFGQSYPAATLSGEAMQRLRLLSPMESRVYRSLTG